MTESQRPRQGLRILLVDDRPAVRDGLRMRLALEPDFRVIGEAVDGLEALKQARDLSPDVVVMDVEMPRLDGLAAAEALHIIAPQCKVVFLSIHDEARVREHARETGAAAFVAKQAGDAVLITAIRLAKAPRPGAGEPSPTKV